jgi:hypothetical protein
MGSYVSEDVVYEIGICWVLSAITVRHFRGIVHVIFLLIEPLVGAFQTTRSSLLFVILEILSRFYSDSIIRESIS